MDQITIKELANILKVSKSTVSRALNNHPDIKEDTKKMILALAQSLDYQPNSVALSLRKSKTFAIGVIVPKISHHFFSQVISGIQEVAFTSSYSVLISQTNDRFDREVIDTENFLHRKVDGIIISPTNEINQVSNKHLQKIHAKKVPLVFIDRYDTNIEASVVTSDDSDGAFNAVEHLISGGCSRIAHLAGDTNISTAQNRLNGYLKALAKYEIPVDDKLIVKKGFSIQDGSDAVDELINRNTKFDSIFAVLDDVAIGAMLRLKEKGYKIPEDVAVIGFSNDVSATIVEPKLSTINQYALEIGQNAAKLLMKQIENKSDFQTHETIRLKTKLVVRESSIKKRSSV